MVSYQITAEVKKVWQAWGTVNLIRKSPMTEQVLIKTLSTVVSDSDFGNGKSKVEVQVRNFQCVRVYYER